MTREELIHEIKEMVCPWHMEHPDVEIGGLAELTITTCCKKFRSQVLVNIDDHLNGGSLRKQSD